MISDWWLVIWWLGELVGGWWICMVRLIMMIGD